MSALLLACSQPAINYSAEARSYSIFLFLSLMSTYVLMSIIVETAATGECRRLTLRFVIYAALAVLTIYTHWFGLLVLLVQSAAILIYNGTVWRIACHYLVSLVGIGLCCAPLIVLIRNEVGLRQGTGGFMWPGRPRLHSLYGLASFLAGGQILLGVAVVVGILAYRKVKARPTNLRGLSARHALFLGNYLIAPPIIVFALSTVLAHYTFFVFRYFLPFLTSVPILIGIAICRLEKRTAILAVSIFLLAPFASYTIYRQKPEIRGSEPQSAPPLINKLGMKRAITPYSRAAKALQASCNPDTVIVHLSPISFLPLSHYSTASCANQKMLLGEGPGMNRVRLNLRSGMMKADDVIRIQTLYRYSEVDVIIDPLDDGDDVESVLQGLKADPAFTLESESEFDGLRLLRYSLRRPPE